MATTTDRLNEDLKAAREQAMFGMSSEAALADWQGYLDANAFSRRQRDMSIASALSDVQELIARGESDEARQLINRIKHGVWETEVEPRR